MYINTQTLQYPIQEFQIRSMFGNTMIPTTLTDTWLQDNNFCKVLPVEPPQVSKLYYIQEIAPVKNGSKYYQTYEVIKHPLPVCKQILLTHFNNMFNQLIGQVKQSYPSTEVESWAKQEKEAREYLADNNSPAIIVRAIASARGVPVGLLAQKIVEKADQYGMVVGNLIGTRQMLEDQINAATEETIDSITWPPED